MKYFEVIWNLKKLSVLLFQCILCICGMGQGREAIINFNLINLAANEAAHSLHKFTDE